MRAVWLISLAAQLMAVGQSVSVSLVEDDVVVARLKRLEQDNRERRQTLEAHFQEKGIPSELLAERRRWY